MPFKTYYLDPEGTLRQDLDEKDTLAAFESKQGLLWVDVSETTEEDGQFMGRLFKFHPLAVEDCISTQIHPPKIDDFGEYLFIIVHGINHMLDSDIVETAEMAIFIGPHFVVSNHSFPLYSVSEIERLVENDTRLLRRGVDFLAHALIDALVDNVLPTIDKMEETADDIEEETVRRPQQSTIEAILKLKRSTLRVHRVMAPQREVLNRLSRGEFPIIKNEAQIFYRDIYDHIARIEDLNQTLRDRADNVLTTYLSSVANRQNEVMKILSIVAAIFLPLTLVTGIFGMNFENMPELGLPWGYYAVLGLIGFAIFVVIGLFWARGWINWGRRRVVILRPFAVEREKLRGHFDRLGKRQNQRHERKTEDTKKEETV